MTDGSVVSNKSNNNNKSPWISSALLAVMQISLSLLPTDSFFFQPVPNLLTRRSLHTPLTRRAVQSYFRAWTQKIENRLFLSPPQNIIKVNRSCFRWQWERLTQNTSRQSWKSQNTEKALSQTLKAPGTARNPTAGANCILNGVRLYSHTVLCSWKWDKIKHEQIPFGVRVFTQQRTHQYRGGLTKNTIITRLKPDREKEKETETEARDQTREKVTIMWNCWHRILYLLYIFHNQPTLPRVIHIHRSESSCVATDVTEVQLWVWLLSPALGSLISAVFLLSLACL